MATPEQIKAAKEAWEMADEGGGDIDMCWDAAIDAATAPLLGAIKAVYGAGVTLSHVCHHALMPFLEKQQ